MKRAISIFISLIYTILSIAQTGSISGEIIEQNNSKLIPFANIAVINSNTNQVIKGGTSNISGTFVISQIPAGIYTLKISYLGFESFQTDSIVVNVGENSIIKTIYLSQKLTELNEVKITAERPMIEQQLGKTTLNISESMAGTGESALDLIQYIPSATTDEENNVILRGAPATILIDGVETDLEKVLESLPIEAIDKMEVITNPSAKYSSQNGAGIINIVLKKDKLKGANGRANIAIGTPEKIQSGANLMLKVKKWSLYSNINIKHFTDDISTLTKRRTESDMDTSFLSNNGNIQRKVNNIVVRQGFKYHINRKANIHVSGAYRYNVNSYNSFNNSENYYADSSLKSHNQNITDGTIKKQYWNVSANYIKQFSSTSELRVITKHENQNNNHPYFRTINYFDIATGEQDNKYTTQNRDYPELIKSNRVQADFEHGINKHLKLEVGALLLHRKSDAGNYLLKTTYNYNETDSLFETVEDSSQNYEFEITEWMPSAYTLLTTELGDWNLSGGIRYEYVHFKSYSPTNDSLAINKHNNFLPTLQVSKKVNQKLTIGITASQRTKMPKYKQLNPFVSYHGLYSKSGGNPNLKPEKIWNIELNTQSLLKKHTINSSIFYRYFSNMISRHQHIVIEDGNEVLYRQYQNLGNVTQVGMELNGNSRLTKTFRVKINVMLLNQQIMNNYNGENTNIEDFVYNGKVTINHSLWKDYQWQITAVYNSPIQSVSGTKYTIYYLNFRLKKAVLNKKGSVNLLFYDIFNTLDRQQLNTTSSEFEVNNYSKGITRKVMLSFSYRFNTKKNHNGKI